jgi:ArsR family metal-binding transcriptional regulator
MQVTTFPATSELGKAIAGLDALGLAYSAVSAAPGYARVGTGALILDTDTRIALEPRSDAEFVSSGWVEFRPEEWSVPDEQPPAFDEPVFASSAIMVLAPCVADPTKVRVTAHLAGDLAPVFPYVNAEMRSASFNPAGPNLTYLDGYRMIALYPNRITIAKADGVVDAWRVLESIRTTTNAIWERRGDIEPDYETRKRPPALEIYKRLPGTNCRACGQPTCLAFASKLWLGHAHLEACMPVFAGERHDLRDALVDIARGLGVSAPE